MGGEPATNSCFPSPAGMGFSPMWGWELHFPLKSLHDGKMPGGMYAVVTSMAQAACPESSLIISLKVFQQLPPQSAATNGTRGTQSPNCGARELCQGSAPSLVLQAQVQPEGALSLSLKQDFRLEFRPSL